MIYPVGDGTKQTFENLWYVAQGFGNPVPAYGYHEGADINLKTGGDTDLGQELKSIAAGRITNYHYGSHPSTGFGRHIIYRIEGAWGTRWVHYAHCQDVGFLNSAQDVVEGQVIARLGKSGTPYAHLHMSIFKVDPATFGIDNVANTTTELNQYWEDPIAFLNTWTQAPPALVITDQTRIPQIDNKEVQQIRSELEAKTNRILELEARIQGAKNALG